MHHFTELMPSCVTSSSDVNVFHLCMTSEPLIKKLEYDLKFNFSKLCKHEASLNS